MRIRIIFVRPCRDLTKKGFDVFGKKYQEIRILTSKENKLMSRNLLNTFFLSSPVYRGLVEEIILIGTGICGLIFSWKQFPIFPLSHMLGGIVILVAFGFHWISHERHKQAHEIAQEIKTIVTAGSFSKIRHPLYLSLIFMNIGIGIAFGVMITFILALVTIIHWVLTALKEEEALMEKFPADYSSYKQRVRWRMIPWVF
jgi:protein-S-isoprenylcysteine O-methyltransferase Ste14